MRMKELRVLFLGLATFLLTKNIEGQVVAGRYVWNTSKKYRTQKDYDAVGDFIYNENAIFLVNKPKKEALFNFLQFSPDLQFQKENFINLKDKLPGDVRFIELLTLKNSAYLFLRDLNNKTKEIDFGLKFLPDQLSTSDPIELFKPSARIRGGATIWTSEDKSKFLFTYTLLPEIKHDRYSKDKIGCFVFDENLQKLWGAEFEMPFIEEQMEVLDYVLTNEGEVYILTGVRNDFAYKENKDYHFEVIHLSKDSKDIGNPIIIKTDGVSIIDGKIVETPNHEILIVGNYSTKVARSEFRNLVKGILIQTIKDGKTTGDVYKYTLTIDMMPKLRGMEAKMYEKYGANYIGYEIMKIQKVHFMDDGSMRIIMDRDFSRQMLTTNKPPEHAVEGLPMPSFYGALIFSIGADKNLQWKKRVQYNDGCCINTIAINKEVHVFFNDNNKIKVEKFDAEGNSTLTSFDVKEKYYIALSGMLNVNNNTLIGRFLSMGKFDNGGYRITQLHSFTIKD